MMTKPKYYTQPDQQPALRCTAQIKPWALEKAKVMASEDGLPLIKVVTDAVMNQFYARQ